MQKHLFVTPEDVKQAREVLERWEEQNKEDKISIADHNRRCNYSLLIGLMCGLVIGLIVSRILLITIN